jgi:hypothetical protein
MKTKRLMALSDIIAVNNTKHKRNVTANCKVVILNEVIQGGLQLMLCPEAVSTLVYLESREHNCKGLRGVRAL